jgi:hypothetical protein
MDESGLGGKARIDLSGPPHIFYDHNKMTND